MSNSTCHEEVTRRGTSQPCDKTAVAMRLDPEDRSRYPVCARHARAEMVPLETLLSETYQAGWDDALMPERMQKGR